MSVRLMTFNHEQFIGDAMQSIMAQQVNFAVEVVVGDDFSTDKTLEIVKSFKDTERIHIRILQREKGDAYFRKRQALGRLYNFVNIIENCRGKYIAMLDGDDYWCDPQKLQKQVDFLESNPDCVLSHHWHKIAEMDANGKWIVKEAPTIGQGYYPQEKSSVDCIFANKLRVKSRTVMFRNVLHEFPTWFYQVAFGDVPLSMILGKYGKIGFLDEPMAVYRVTGKGVSTAGSEDWLFTYRHFIEWIRIWEYGTMYYGNKYQNEALRTINHFYKTIAKRYNYSYVTCSKMLNYAATKSQLPFHCRMLIFSKLLCDIMIAKIKRL